MSREEMCRKLESVYDRLQSMAFAPTVGNLETMLKSLYDIREVYQELNKKEGADDGRQTANTK